MSQDEISGYGGGYRIFNPLHFGVYKNYSGYLTFIQPISFGYPNVNADFGNQLESRLTELYDVYERVRDFQINP